MNVWTKTGRSVLKPLAFGVAAAAAAGIGLPAASAQTAGSLAGYNLGATSAAVQFELNSPGLLPVGDPTVGNIFSVDIPLSRTTASSGPQIDALGSPLYPGDPAAHLGTAIATFGGPEEPNDPAVAEANYPPTPTNGSSASFSVPGTQNGAFSAGPATSQSQASPTGASVDSVVGDIAAGPPVGTAANLVHIQGAHSTNSIQIGDSLVSSTATATATGIDIAGQVQIASVDGSAGGTSDGNTGTPSASLSIGKVTVAGQPAYIDQSGIHLAGQGGGGPAVDFANSVLQNLAAAGVTVHTISPTETTDGAVGSGDSGAVVVSLSTQTPTVPGLAPLAPGAPPTPGAPSVPVEVNILLGNATATANGSPFPNFGDLSTGGSFDSSGSSLTSSNGGVSASSGSGTSGVSGASPSLAPTTATIPPTGPGSSPRAARLGAVLADLSKPIPVGLAVGILFAALCAAGGLLAYARWQLIDGRHS
jgi:hypothetical protein